MRWLTVLGILFFAPVQAEPVPCGQEGTARGRAYCLEMAVEVLRNHMDSRIASATAGLDETPGPGSRRFARDLARAQRGWRRRADRACRDWGIDPVMVQECRLAETQARWAYVRDLLSEARERAGLPALAEEIEIRVPLPRPPGGPDLDLAVPVPGFGPGDSGPATR